MLSGRAEQPSKVPSRPGCGPSFLLGIRGAVNSNSRTPSIVYDDLTEAQSMFPTRSSYAAAGALAALQFTVVIGLGQSQLQPPAPPVPMPALLRDYQPVTPERLSNPEDGNWLSIRRTYDGWGYSPLDQIGTDNVKSLRPVWIFSTGETKVHDV